MREGATVTIDGQPGEGRPGDAIFVPPRVPFVLGNGGDGPLRMLCCMPVGGQASLPGGDPFTPPWAE